MTNARARLLWTASAVIVVTVGTLIAIRFARGYRPSRDVLVEGKGLLVANSTPQGASVFVDGRFLTATDDTLYLTPGDYRVEIKQDGYFSWEKNVVVEREIVTQANALLFPTAPSLSPLTFSGAQKPIPSPDGQRIAFYTASSSAETKNGYYVLELSDNPLAFQRGPRQIATPSPLFPVEETQILWSPDSSQVLLLSPSKTVLLDPGRNNTLETQPDVSFQLQTILSQWEEEMYLRDRERLLKFPDLIQKIATESAVNVYFSPQEDKMLYTATTVFTLPDGILPAKPGSSTQPQERTTHIGGIYVYDREEDRQFRIGTDQQYLDQVTATAQPTPRPTPAPRRRTTAVESPVALPFNPQKKLLSNDLFSRQPQTLEASPSAFQRLQAENTSDTIMNFLTYHSPLYSHGYQWFPNSHHFVYHDETGITITEYDNTNSVKIYSGPFNHSFVYPWPNGSRMIMLTNFQVGGNAPENLYTIDLK